MSYIWTGGRKCDFLPACGRVDLQPAIIFGWFWAPTKVHPFALIYYLNIKSDLLT